MRSIRKSCSTKRRSYLLLEVLIAMTLVALVAVPMLRPAVAILRDEQSTVRQLENERLVHQVHVSLLEDLYRNTIPWEEVTTEQWQTYPGTTVAYQFTMPRNKHQNPSRHLVALQLQTGQGRDTVTREYIHFLEKEDGVVESTSPSEDS